MLSGWFDHTQSAPSKFSLVLRDAECGKCGLHKGCTNPFMPVRGKGKRKILVVGEAPDKTEDEKNKPFVGKIGRRLQDELDSVGIDLFQDCWVINAARCRPKDNILSPESVKYCRPNVIKDIDKLKPEIIILAGWPAVRSVIGHYWKEDIGDNLNRWLNWHIPCQALNAWLCHPAGILVTTKKGLVPIEYVKVGNSVLTHNGIWKKVIETFARDFDGNVIKIKRAYSSKELEATPEHPLLINRKDNLKWVLAGKLRIGDYLVEPIPVEPEKVIDGEVIWKYSKEGKKSSGNVACGEQSVKAEYHTMRLLGYYLAEGYKFSLGTTGFAFHKREKKFQKQVVKSFKSVFKSGNNISVRPASPGIGYSTSRGVELMCNGIVAQDFFKTAGNGASFKKFPDWVWKCSDSLLKTMLQALWNGDGWVQCGRDLGIQFCSRQLIEDVRRLLLRFGIISNLRQMSSTLSGFPNRKSTWELSVRGRWAIKLASIVGRTLPNISKNRGIKRDVFIKDGYVHYQIKKITERKSKEKVYNIEVQDDHSYLADGIVSHNCPIWHPSFIERNSEGRDSKVIDLLWHKQLESISQLSGRPWNKVPDYASKVEIVLNSHEAAAILDSFQEGRVAYDTETDCLKPDSQWSSIVYCSVCWQGKRTIAFCWQGKAIQAFRDLVRRKGIYASSWNDKHDLRWIRKKEDIDIRNHDVDGMLESHVLCNKPGTKSLKFQSWVRLGQDSYDHEIKPFLKSKGNNQKNRIREFDRVKALRYCGMDSLLDYKLKRIMAKEIKHVSQE